jgi:hypothetical protein
VVGSAPSGVGNQELYTVEGSASSETEEEPTRSFSVRTVGNVGAPATRGSFAPPFGKERNNF